MLQIAADVAELDAIVVLYVVESTWKDDNQWNAQPQPTKKPLMIIATCTKQHNNNTDNNVARCYKYRVTAIPKKDSILYLANVKIIL